MSASIQSEPVEKGNQNTELQPEQKVFSLCSYEACLARVKETKTLHYITMASLVMGLFWAIFGGNIGIAVILGIGAAAHGWLLYHTYYQVNQLATTPQESA